MDLNFNTECFYCGFKFHTELYQRKTARCPRCHDSHLKFSKTFDKIDQYKDEIKKDPYNDWDDE